MKAAFILFASNKKSSLDKLKYEEAPDGKFRHLSTNTLNSSEKNSDGKLGGGSRRFDE